MTTVTANGNIYSDDGSSAKDMTNGGHRVHLLPMLSDVMTDVAARQSTATTAATTANTAASAAASSATAAAASLAAAQTLTGGAQSIGTDPLGLPRNAELGSAAFVDWERLPLRLHAVTAAGVTTLVPGDGGKLVLAAYSLTLPSAGDPAPEMSQGWAVVIRATTAVVTIAAQAGQTIDGASTIRIGPGASVIVVRTSATAYQTIRQSFAGDCADAEEQAAYILAIG